MVIVFNVFIFIFLFRYNMFRVKKTIIFLRSPCDQLTMITLKRSRAFYKILFKLYFSYFKNILTSNTLIFVLHFIITSHIIMYYDPNKYDRL